MELKSKKSTGRKPDRLGLKLAIIFGASLVLTITLLMASSFLMTTFFKQESKAPKKIIVNTIDPKLEEDLVAALEFDEVPKVARATDPFVDREGLGREVANKQQISTGKSVISSAPELSSGDRIRGQAAGGSNSTTTEEKPDPSEETKSRWAAREERSRSGRAPGAEAAVFAMADLEPIGSFRFGNRPVEVSFYSKSLERKFTFPVGTRFYDGVLQGITDGGVIFSELSSKGGRIFKSWLVSVPKPKTNSKNSNNSKNGDERKD